jgi:hypothetical protein
MQGPHHTERETPIRHYHVENEVMLYFEHPVGWLPQAQSDITGGALQEVLVGNENQEIMELLRGVVYSADHYGVQLSLLSNEDIRVTVFTLPLAGVMVGDFVQAVNKHIGENADPQGFLKVQLGVRLGKVVPNNYLGASSHNSIGTHGPGRIARPVFLPEEELVALSNIHAEGGSMDCDVEIYILDTIPPQERIVDAWNAWGSTTLVNFRDILEPVSQTADTYETAKALYIYGAAMHQHYSVLCHEHAEELTLHQMLPIDPSSPTYVAHEHDTADHGLFIAGLINRRLPDSQLYVIQVLNNFGIGTLSNLIAGFQKVRELQLASSVQRAVINCSFTVAMGRHDDMSAISMLLTAMSKCMLDGNKIMVAAAGNDSDRNHLGGVHNAGYPADLDFVVGVGALDKHNNPASYSNRADNPPSFGFMIFGGDYVDVDFTDMTTSFADGGDGIIGVYTGDFAGDLLSKPPHDPPTLVSNNNGFAEWAGTSFATPIVCARLAKSLCDANPVPGVSASDVAIADIQAEATETTSEGEPAIPDAALDHS